MEEQVEQGFKYAKLSFHEPRDIYYAGQVLSGDVTIELSRPLEFSVANIHYLGEANVFWTENEFEEYNGVRRNVSVKYQAKETYFDVIHCIAGGLNVPSTIPPGVTRIPFQFQIPHIAPSSFSGEQGSVSYKVVIYVEYPNPAVERDQLEKDFEVVAPMDLNKEDIMRPLNIEFEEFYSCCCSSAPMTITIDLPHHGYCPGQTIPIRVKAYNESSTEVQRIVLQLVKKVCFHSKEPKSDYIPPDEVIETLKTKPILGNSKQETTYSMVVPDMIAPNLQNCSIIDVGFFLKVLINVSGCNDDLEDEFEICIGLIPIASTVENEPYIHPLQSDLPQGPIPDPSAVPISAAQNNTAAVNTEFSQPNIPTAGYPPSAAMNTGFPQPNIPGYPIGSPHPNPSGYPQVSPLPQNPYPKPVGFALPETPPGNGSAPYPLTSPYPMGNIGSSPYPTDSAPSAPPPS